VALNGHAVPDGNLDEDPGCYTDRQCEHDREYAAAWEDAPPEFRRAAELLGIEPEPSDHSGMAMEYNDEFAQSATIPNMADVLDQFVDEIIEVLGQKYNWTPEQRIFYAALIHEIYSWLRKPMEDELVRNRANLLGRVSCYLVQDEKGNLKARVHALLHSIPRLAAENGFPSMRSSAKVCGVSPEWLRRKRDSWCDLLEIARPANGTKSEEAKQKYRENALTNHWRKQTYKRNGNSNGNGNHSHHQQQCTH
jgi:hypothetical protein